MATQAPPTLALLALVFSLLLFHVNFTRARSVASRPIWDETDNDETRKVLGSSVVTSVSVIMDLGNGTQAVYADSTGRPVPKPSDSSKLASPPHLMSPDRYEFYTFNDAGDLVKRLMTLEEIQSLIAGESVEIGSDLPGIEAAEHDFGEHVEERPPTFFFLPRPVEQNQDWSPPAIDKVVERVQNVLAAMRNTTSAADNVAPGSGGVEPTWSILPISTHTPILENVPTERIPVVTHIYQISSTTGTIKPLLTTKLPPGFSTERIPVPTSKPMKPAITTTVTEPPPKPPTPPIRFPIRPPISPISRPASTSTTTTQRPQEPSTMSTWHVPQTSTPIPHLSTFIPQPADLHTTKKPVTRLPTSSIQPSVSYPSVTLSTKPQDTTGSPVTKITSVAASSIVQQSSTPSKPAVASISTTFTVPVTSSSTTPEPETTVKSTTSAKPLDINENLESIFQITNTLLDRPSTASNILTSSLVPVITTEKTESKIPVTSEKPMESTILKQRPSTENRPGILADNTQGQAEVSTQKVPEQTRPPVFSTQKQPPTFSSSVASQASSTTLKLPEVTRPAAEITRPRPEVTRPVAEVTRPATDVTRPRPEITRPAADVTRPRPEVTRPAVEVTRPVAEFTRPSSVSTTQKQPEKTTTTHFSTTQANLPETSTQFVLLSSSNPQSTLFLGLSSDKEPAMSSMTSTSFGVSTFNQFVSRPEIIRPPHTTLQEPVTPPFMDSDEDDVPEEDDDEGDIGRDPVLNSGYGGIALLNRPLVTDKINDAVDEVTSKTSEVDITSEHTPTVQDLSPPEIIKNNTKIPPVKIPKPSTPAPPNELFELLTEITGGDTSDEEDVERFETTEDPTKYPTNSVPLLSEMSTTLNQAYTSVTPSTSDTETKIPSVHTTLHFGSSSAYTTRTPVPSPQFSNVIAPMSTFVPESSEESTEIVSNLPTQFSGIQQTDVTKPDFSSSEEVDDTMFTGTSSTKLPSTNFVDITERMTTRNPSQPILADSTESTDPESMTTNFDLSTSQSTVKYVTKTSPSSFEKITTMHPTSPSTVTKDKPFIKITTLEPEALKFSTSEPNTELEIANLLHDILAGGAEEFSTDFPLSSTSHVTKQPSPSSTSAIKVSSTTIGSPTAKTPVQATTQKLTTAQQISTIKVTTKIPVPSSSPPSTKKEPATSITTPSSTKTTSKVTSTTSMSTKLPTTGFVKLSTLQTDKPSPTTPAGTSLKVTTTKIPSESENWVDGGNPSDIPDLEVSWQEPQEVIWTMLPNPETTTEGGTTTLDVKEPAKATQKPLGASSTISVKVKPNDTKVEEVIVDKILDSFTGNEIKLDKPNEVTKPPSTSATKLASNKFSEATKPITSTDIDESPVKINTMATTKGTTPLPETTKKTTIGERVKVSTFGDKEGSFTKLVPDFETTDEDMELVSTSNTEYEKLSTIPVKSPSGEMALEGGLPPQQEPEVTLVQASVNNLGLEATTVALDEDIRRFIDLSNDLAIRMFKHVTSELDKRRSVVLSPFGATSLLAMVFLGARGQTSAQMNDFLPLDDMVTFNPHLVLRNITDSVILSPDLKAAAIVRQLYSQQSKGRLLDFYKARASAFYDGLVQEVDFDEVADVVRGRTNELVRTQTSERVPNFLSNTATLRLRPPLAALSANVFQMDCQFGSSGGRNAEMPFSGERPGAVFSLPSTVWGGQFLIGYDAGLDATAVEIPLSAGSPGGALTSTVFVMPGRPGIRGGIPLLARLEARLISRRAWSGLLRNLVRTRDFVEVQVPRFEHRSVLNLTVPLRRMGLKDIFTEGQSDLRGVNGIQDLFLTDVMQVNAFSACSDPNAEGHVETYPTSRRTGRLGSRVGVDDLSDDEEDEPDWRRTAARLPLALRPRQARIPPRGSGPSSPSRPPSRTPILQLRTPRFRLDRPFLYFVRHNPTGAILHVGRFNPRFSP